MLEKQGISTENAVEILNTLPTTSPALQIAGNLMAAKNFEAMFPIELVEKDFGYALDTAQSFELKTPTIAAVRDIYAEAVQKGYGDSNIVGVKQLFKKAE